MCHYLWAVEKEQNIGSPTIQSYSTNTMEPFLCHGLGHSGKQTLPSSAEGRAWPVTHSAVPGLHIRTYSSTVWYVGVGVCGVGLWCSTGASNLLRDITSCHMETWEVSEKQHSEVMMPIS